MYIYIYKRHSPFDWSKAGRLFWDPVPPPAGISVTPRTCVFRLYENATRQRTSVSLLDHACFSLPLSIFDPFCRQNCNTSINARHLYYNLYVCDDKNNNLVEKKLRSDFLTLVTQHRYCFARKIYQKHGARKTKSNCFCFDC